MRNSLQYQVNHSNCDRPKTMKSAIEIARYFISHYDMKSCYAPLVEA